ncbi:hypothetical protein D3C76_1273720 [compost metagenome]
MANRLNEVGFCSNADQKNAAETSRIKQTSSLARSLRFKPANMNSQIKYRATEAAITYTSTLATATGLMTITPCAIRVTIIATPTASASNQTPTPFFFTTGLFQVESSPTSLS